MSRSLDDLSSDFQPKVFELLARLSDTESLATQVRAVNQTQHMELPMAFALIVILLSTVTTWSLHPASAWSAVMWWLAFTCVWSVLVGASWLLWAFKDMARDAQERE